MKSLIVVRLKGGEYLFHYDGDDIYLFTQHMRRLLKRKHPGVTLTYYRTEGARSFVEDLENEWVRQHPEVIYAICERDS